MAAKIVEMGFNNLLIKSNRGLLQEAGRWATVIPTNRIESRAITGGRQLGSRYPNCQLKRLGAWPTYTIRAAVYVRLASWWSGNTLDKLR